MSFTLEVENVSHSYHGCEVLKDITLSVPRGEFLSIVGPSGSGKSTLLKIMAGIIIPSAGEVRFEGASIAALKPKEHGVLMMWQSLALFPHLNVADNVGFGLKVRNVQGSERSRRVREVLEMVELSGFEQRAVNGLSGGEQQRVALARTLALQPSVLLLDEPVQGLDRNLRFRLITTIRTLHHRLGITMVMVTHEQGEALTLSSRVAVMRRGHIEQIDTPNRIFRYPNTRFVAEFLGDRNIFIGRVLKTEYNSVLVATPIGDMTAGLPKWITYQPAIGEKVAYIIDAHKVRLCENAANTIKAMVDSVVVTGIAESIELTNPAISYAIKCQRPSQENTPGLGQSVTLGWDETDAYVLPAN